MSKKPLVVLIAATSRDGYIARYSGDFVQWSKEDYKFFIDYCTKAGNFIMGQVTYDSIPAERKPPKGRFTLIFTRQDLSHLNIPGKVKYWNSTPEAAIKYLADKKQNGVNNFTTICIAGGSQIHDLFVGANLVDEAYITVESVVFENGVPLFTSPEFKNRLVEIDHKKINSGGSVLYHYKVQK